MLLGTNNRINGRTVVRINSNQNFVRNFANRSTQGYLTNFVYSGNKTTEKEKSDLQIGYTVSVTLLDTEEKLQSDNPKLPTSLMKYIHDQYNTIGKDRYYTS